MTAVQVLGNPSPQEAAALMAALQLVIDGDAAAAGPELPWAYRSRWRTAAITDGIRRDDWSVDVS